MTSMKFVEPTGEVVLDDWQLESEEVDACRFAVGAAFLAELCVELYEEARIDLDGSTFGHAPESWLPRWWRCVLERWHGRVRGTRAALGRCR
jgi:hypothetical protein